MINNCPRCNKTPRVNVDVSCQNVKCQEFGISHYVYDWQKLVKPEVLIKDLTQSYDFPTTC